MLCSGDRGVIACQFCMCRTTSGVHWLSPINSPLQTLGSSRQSMVFTCATSAQNKSCRAKIFMYSRKSLRVDTQLDNDRWLPLFRGHGVIYRAGDTNSTSTYVETMQICPSAPPAPPIPLYASLPVLVASLLSKYTKNICYRSCLIDKEE